MQWSDIPVVRYVVVMCDESRANSGPGHVFSGCFLETRAFPKTFSVIRGEAMLPHRVAGSNGSAYPCGDPALFGGSMVPRDP